MIDLTVAVPLIIALVSGTKTAGLNSKYAPLLSISLGMAAFYFLGSGDTAARLLEGLIAGLTASGLYSGVKTTVLK